MRVMAKKNSPKEADVEQKKTEHSRFQLKQSINRHRRRNWKRTSSLTTSVAVLEDATMGDQLILLILSNFKIINNF